MKKGAHIFYPASRREDPDWLNPKSLTAGPDDPAIKRFNNRLAKPLRVETCAEENISWILNVFLDSLVDLRPPHSVQFEFRETNLPTTAANSLASPGKCRANLASNTSRSYRRITFELAERINISGIDTVEQWADYS